MKPDTKNLIVKYKNIYHSPVSMLESFLFFFQFKCNRDTLITEILKLNNSEKNEFLIAQ